MAHRLYYLLAPNAKITDKTQAFFVYIYSSETFYNWFLFQEFVLLLVSTFKKNPNIFIVICYITTHIKSILESTQSLFSNAF